MLLWAAFHAACARKEKLLLLMKSAHEAEPVLLRTPSMVGGLSMVRFSQGGLRTFNSRNVILFIPPRQHLLVHVSRFQYHRLAWRNPCSRMG